MERIHSFISAACQAKQYANALLIDSYISESMLATTESRSLHVGVAALTSDFSSGPRLRRRRVIFHGPSFEERNCYANCLKGEFQAVKEHLMVAETRWF
ncbi:hypothetical protein CDAR_423921 [Caerostris darwini]|uniref:Uncharacterized protein n=1 Tax=Caerostris darwini TaxID=1538125 RepID=A0AAV4VEC1_9ARAC|nr:hypothetical protein CDAR_423921 [Caerostris darwini]